MIPPRNPWYRQALAAPHEAYARVEIWRAGIQLDELAWRQTDSPYTRGVPVFYDGAVRATLASQVTRTLSLTLPDYLYPWLGTELLHPYGTELRAFKGVRYGNDSPDEFQVFTGTIEKISPPRRGQCALEASDIALRTAAAGFLFPMPSQVGDLIVDEFERIVLDAYPLATFGTHSPITDTVPPLAYDGDRGQALDSLAGAAVAFWYTLPDGRHVLRSVPWTVPVTTAPLLLADGPGGTLLEAHPVRAATGIYNQVVVLSDRSDGGPALWAQAADNDPASPTYVGGPFGRRTAPAIRVTGATNQGQLIAVARVALQRYRALTAAWEISCVPDASIELGDPLNVRYGGQKALQFATSFTLPLNPRAPMSIQGRDLAGVDAA